MATTFKRTSSANNLTLFFNTSDLDEGLPTMLSKDAPVETNTMGVNLDNLDIYYFNGEEWIKTE